MKKKKHRRQGRKDERIGNIFIKLQCSSMQISSKLWGELKPKLPFRKGQYLTGTALPNITVTLSHFSKLLRGSTPQSQHGD